MTIEVPTSKDLRGFVLWALTPIERYAYKVSLGLPTTACEREALRVIQKHMNWRIKKARTPMTPKEKAAQSILGG